MRKLLLLSGNRCAFDECNNPLTHKGILIGELAHITAAEPGGPRYDITKDDNFRRSFENLFYLCRHHHGIIDKSDFVEEYPTELLVKMKAKHEKANESTQFEVEDNLLDQAIDQISISQGNVLGTGTQYNVQQNIFSDLAASAQKAADEAASLPVNEEETEIDDLDQDEENGVLDKIADTETTIPIWTQTIDEMAAEIRKVGPIFEAGVTGVKKSDSLNKGVSGRLAVFKGVAKNLNEPATNIELLGKQYIDQFNIIEPGLLAALDMAEESREDIHEYDEFLRSILTLAESGAQGLAPVADMVNNMQSISSMSKDMRKVLKKMCAGLDTVLESSSRMELWSERIHKLTD